MLPVKKIVRKKKGQNYENAEIMKIIITD